MILVANMVKEIRFCKFKRLVVWTKGKFGTGEGLLGYGMDARYRRGAPGVRDAFSKALGAKNRRFRYGRDIRYQKPPSYGTGLTLISEER